MGFGKLLLSSCAALATATGLAAAQDTPHVAWHDDGSVTIKTDPEYDSVEITLPAGALGTLFGPGQKPFEGEEVTILSLDSGPKGGISGPLYMFRPIFEELSGAKVNVALTPISELYTKAFLDLRNGTGEYDAIVVGAFFYGDLIAGNYMLAVDDWMKSGEYPQWSYDVMPESLKSIYTWDNVGYGVLSDADGQILYYRRDLLTDPTHQAAFKAEFGYDMPVPPATLQQLRDIAKYFHGKNYDTTDQEPDSGIVLHLKVREQGLYHFTTLATSFAMTPGDKLDRTHNVYWFDPVDMTPLINSPGHVRALEFLKDLAQYGPPAQVSWSLGEAWDYFLRGKAVFNFSYGDVGALAQDPERSTIRGKLGSSILPASDTYWDMETKAFVTLTEPRQVGNVTGGSWHGIISALGDNPEAAYAFLSLMATEPVSKYLATIGWDGVDPGYTYQWLEPQGEAKLTDYTESSLKWNAQDVEEYLKAYYDDFNAPTRLPYLRITGTQEYYDSLDSNLSAAMSGAKSPQQALDDTAAAWQQITDRLGRDQQLKNYQEAIGWTGE
jgi:multiple sugar transport system substrate-binding protein